MWYLDTMQWNFKNQIGSLGTSNNSLPDPIDICHAEQSDSEVIN